MCGTCGCGGTSVGEKHGGRLDEHEHAREHEHVDEHGHAYRHTHAHAHDGHAARRVQVERDLLEKNDRIAAKLRARYEASRTLALNLVSSPGAGKTSLLVRTLHDLGGRWPLAVIEGDQQTHLDADRIVATGVTAVQVNTGAMCHLDAGMIEGALELTGAPGDGVLFIENVGNLVCPAGFDLGEAGKVVLVSVTEGEDKPLKYAPMFHAARLVLVTKIDLLPHLDFDVDALVGNVARVNAAADVLRVSVRSGEGLRDWYGWIEDRQREVGP